MDLPSSLARDISPPRPVKRRKTSGISSASVSASASPSPINTPLYQLEPTLAAVEAGKARVDDHLTYFTHHLSKSSRQTSPDTPRLSIDDFSSLYQSNQHAHGHHFVIHQHNHPKAGVHYDLRLQFSESSSISFAIPKGLPGNPNSRSIGRMAIETRVHNYWNHLIESASYKTGSLLIWDTGTYEVLPRKKVKSGRRGMPSPETTDDEADADSDEEMGWQRTRQRGGDKTHQNEKLIEAFQTKYIRLRLHGTRLPHHYTIILRLPDSSIISRPTARRNRSRKTPRNNQPTKSSSSSPPPHAQPPASDLDTDTDIDTSTRLYNAYPGSTNTIGSIHQRHWFLILDRLNSGFVLDQTGGGKGVWGRGNNGSGFDTFIVRGRDVERSVVTGRLARDVEVDEGCGGFVGRGGWSGVGD